MQDADPSGKIGAAHFGTHCWHSCVCSSPTFLQDDPVTDGNTILAGRTETQSVYFIMKDLIMVSYAV